MNFLREPWQAFRSTVKGFDSSHQIALGVALGMMIGLIPKDSLLPYGVALLALLTNANLLSLIVSTLIFSQLSPLLDPITHPLGAWILTFDPLESIWISLYQTPIVPWTRIENTVVMGTLMLGILLAIPVYSLSYRLYEKFGASISNLVLNNRFARWIVSEQSPNLQKS